MFPDPAALAVFVVASIVLLVVPGPAVLFIVARSVQHGRLSGIVSTAGISTGALVHVIGAALGLAAILMSSVMAFNVVKYLGAAYLVYLGIRTLLAPAGEVIEGKQQRRSLWKDYRQGMVVSLLNPKMTLFLFAFLPQFVDPARGAVWIQIMSLGGLFIAMGFVSDSLYAILAGTVGNWFRSNHRFLSSRKYLSGLTYIGLGLLTAFAEPVQR